MPLIRDSEGFGGKAEARLVSVVGAVPATENWPAAVRARYTTKNGEDVLLDIPMTEDAFEVMKPFLADPLTAQRPRNYSESEIASFFTEHAEKAHVWVRAWKGFIRARLAGPGSHYFRLVDLGKYVRQRDGQERISFTLQTEDGLEAKFSAPYKLEYSLGDTPEKDTISTPGQMWTYLENLGLNSHLWEETVVSADALWPRRGGPDPLFMDPDDITPELLALIQQYGPTTVKITIENDAEYGLGPVRKGQYAEVKMIQVEGTPPPQTESDEKEFQREREVFDAQMDILVKLVTGRDDAVFYENGKESKDGVYVIVNVLVPIVNQYPHVVTRYKANGEPATTIPPTPDSWNLDGLVAINEAVRRLNNLGTELANLTGLIDANDHSKLLEWVADNVPELIQAEGSVY